MNKELKKEVWELLESYKENLSDDIGWGSMDSLCEELIKTIKSKEDFNLHCKCLLNTSDYKLDNGTILCCICDKEKIKN